MTIMTHQAAQPPDRQVQGRFTHANLVKQGRHIDVTRHDRQLIKFSSTPTPPKIHPKNPEKIRRVVTAELTTKRPKFSNPCWQNPPLPWCLAFKKSSRVVRDCPG